MIQFLKRLDAQISLSGRFGRWFIAGSGAFILVLVSGLIRAALQVPILPYLLFLPAIMTSAFLFGMFSGVVSVALATAIAVYFFLPPRGFLIADFNQGLSIALFVLITLGISWICQSLRTSLLSIERSKDELEDRIRVEVEKRTVIEDALHQSQKMEAVGQLTGGLAHDFNNLLTGIICSLDLLSSRLQRGKTEGFERYIETAQSSANRAASLTHRLLAFSRRQTLEPKVVDLGVLVTSMEDMLRRTLGPGVGIKIFRDDNLWPTLVDPSQLESALLNLCINARDAMTGGGEIRIVACNRALDDRLGAERSIPAGDYLSLRVIDTGIGMLPEVVDRVFEPFFTTKPIGVGTGLGLSMVYGFAKQSGGSVKVHSTVGEGTRICLLLPRFFGDVPDNADYSPRLAFEKAEGETVLIVDDEPAIVMLAEETLQSLGYLTLTATTGASGLELLQSGTKIDMLVTDVGLPGGMNGRQMADAGRVTRPSLPILFITGFAETSVLSGGSLGANMSILTKPFVMDELAARVQSILA